MNHYSICNSICVASSHTVHTNTGGLQVSNPCMNHDLTCPHFATRTAGLVRDKFTDIKDEFAEYSPSLV